jgi:RNase P subunit RPR2
MPWGGSQIAVRCTRKDSQTHHLKGGIGRRNRGVSILADWKLRTCDQCHTDITGKILKPTTAEADAHTIKYWRAK